MVTPLFSRKQTASWGYLFNGLLVIYGTVMMTHFGWSHYGGSGTLFISHLYNIITPYIITAWVDFFLGAALFKLWHMEPAGKE